MLPNIRNVRPLSALVVEDDPDDFFLVEALLRSELAPPPASLPNLRDAAADDSAPDGVEVQQAVSVEDALDCITDTRFDVILLDYTLGAHTGLELLDQFRESGITTPVIFLTGHGDEELAVRALKAGAVDYLSKARLNSSALASAVRHALTLAEKESAVREAQEALSARERDYRMLFENANDAILILDPATEAILEANAAACRLYACAHDQLVGHSLVEFSTDVVRGRAAIEQCLSSGSLSNFETVHVARDGRHVHILANSSVVEYRGSPVLLNVFRDISERRAAELEIFRLNRALKALSKCSEAMLHARDQQQLLDEICQIVVEDGGYRLAWVASAPQSPGSPIAALACAGIGREHVEAACLRYNTAPDSALLVPTALRSGQAVVCRDVATDSRTVLFRQECLAHGFFSIIALPLQVEGRTTGALAIYAGERDAFDAAEVELLRELAGNVGFGLESLHAHRQKDVAEGRLRESELRYRTLFERNLAGVFRARADGTLLEANESFVRMLGYETNEELAGLRLPTLCAAAGCAEPWCSELNAAGHLVNRELRVLRKDGSTACLLANLVLLRDHAGAPESMEGTALDITQRRQLEAQLLQSQKMEAIGQLAGGIAHDFNNLLMVIRSYAELAGEKFQDTEARREFDAILKAADRGAALTRQLLTFGRKQAFSPRLLDINSVLESSVKVLPRALGEDVRVEVRPGANLWQVKADPVQIEQLLLNLAVNARDAMPGGGRLILETSNEVLDTEYVKLHAGVCPGEYAMLAVSDTGHGIPPEVLPRIFEPFFTTKERGKGTGLGLSTVYGIVQQSGGFIWVYSEPGAGTVFKIYLPRAGAPAAAAPASSWEDLPLQGTETILLVEDEEAVRTATRTYLALRGYTILEASCGEEALRISDTYREKIDMLVTDAIMPGMSGSVLAGKIAACRPGIRVVFVSGYTEATINEQGVGESATFLQKPFSLAVLARKVREVFASSGVGIEQRVA